MKALSRFTLLLLVAALFATAAFARVAHPKAHRRSQSSAQPAEATPVLGDRHSAIQVIIFEDLECPSCARWHQLLKADVFPKYERRVGFWFHDYPLHQHPWAFNAAVIGRYFLTHSFQLYFGWRDYCFTHQDEITPGDLMDRAARFAAPAGISAADLQSAFGSQKYFALVESDIALGNSVHVQHTPTVFLKTAGSGPTEMPTPQDLQSALNAALSSH
jgi:protein-disulfide isomerase